MAHYFLLFEGIQGLITPAATGAECCESPYEGQAARHTGDVTTTAITADIPDADSRHNPVQEKHVLGNEEPTGIVGIHPVAPDIRRYSQCSARQRQTGAKFKWWDFYHNSQLSKYFFSIFFCHFLFFYKK